MRVKMKHTKIRNTGLLFEFLVRQITADTLNNIKESKATSILKRRFNERTELGRELALYNLLIQKKFNSDKKADYFINQVLSERKKLNNSKLKREKYNLIKEIKTCFNLQNFVSSKIKNYPVYASIFKLFEYENKVSAVEKTEAHFNLVECITTKQKTIRMQDSIKKTLPADEDLRILTYKTLLEKFNQRYSNLNYPQKSLLKAYINNISNTNSLKEYVEKVRPAIKKGLKKHKSKLTDKVVKIKLAEAIKSIDNFCDVGNAHNVKDKVVIQMMRYMELLKGLESIEKK